MGTNGYTDFLKAATLIKMAFEVPPAECQLQRSYLSSKTQRVRNESCFSEEIKETSGFPQGNDLGLCFI
jgi:hypothetical protein